jgi:hypothetical protein
LDVRLPPLSAAYFLFRFDVSVRSVELRHNLRSLQAAGAEVVVFTRQGKDWTLRPRWANEDVHSFCRDRGDDRMDEMLLILGNAAVTTTLTFAAGTLPASVRASRTSCIDPTNTDPNVGFQECEFRFPQTTVGPRSYRHLHRETWELVGSGNLDAATRTMTHAYRWTVVDNGAGLASNPSAEWTSSWTLAPTQVSGSMTLTDESAQNAQSAARVNSARSTQVTITETDRSGTQTHTPTLNEYQWPKRTAPRNATRIEGFDVIQGTPQGQPIYQWPGQGQIAGSPTVTCRWSFPAAPQ